MRKIPVHKPKKCSTCGKEFIPTGTNQKFCSPVCRIVTTLHIDSNDCWNWTCGKINGYGHLTWRNTNMSTHRIMCESAHGPAPIDKTNVLHSCDNPSCCNPAHLRWGTQQENIDDKVSKNRQARGSANNHSILTEFEVTFIISQLKTGSNCQDLADKFGVSKSTISDIKHNRTWKHMPR